jgi:predicted Zn-dependent peptidase
MHARVSARAIIATAVALALLAPTAGAQQALDRTRIPAPGKPPELRVPTWTKTTLANGAELVVSERHDLPLVAFNITFLGGANQFEQADRRGAAGFTASMLSEGTKTRDGEAIARALQLLGTNISTSVGDESGAMGFLSTTSTFEPTLAILADMLVNPIFPAPALERLRGQRLVQLTQANAQPGTIGARVFDNVLYGDAHPYGQWPNETTVKAVTRDDVMAFHKSYFRPGRAIITVVGDVDPKGVKATIERALAEWPAGGEKPVFTYPAVPALKATTIYLVDKPGSAQSVFNLGLPGPARNTPDYFALQVMNTILGGQFQSRLNANIREEKGYSYGVSSRFAYGKGPGAFNAGGDIVTAKSDAALNEFMKELKGIHGARPITDEELKTAKDKLIQSLPGQFGGVQQVNSAITTLLVQGLPEDYYQNYGKAVSAVTKEDVLRVAKKYVDLTHLAIVIVGDRATIEAPLKATGVAPIVLLDIEGKPKS